jgi:adenine deaminase
LKPQIISGQIVDIPARQIYGGEVVFQDGTIVEIRRKDDAEKQFIMPGFIDAHVHIESSMVVPSEFARMAVVHGTVATVSDPHEIANVLGIPGVDYMIENGSKVPFKFYFGAPSCVPATSFETAGAALGPDAIDELLKRPAIKYLAEMMNWPGVIQGDEVVMQKLAIARKYGKVVDGHAPGLNLDQALAYINAGISTDHECVSYDEALHKIKHGMKVLIREGSAAKNFDALIDLLNDYEDLIMFCSDDKHPDSLEDGHINLLVKRALEKGIDLFKVLKAACLNPTLHYGLDVGMLRPGDSADFIVVDNLTDFNVQKTFIRGKLTAENGKTKIQSISKASPNNFRAVPIHSDDLCVLAVGETIRVIEAFDGQLITQEIEMRAKVQDGYVVADCEKDMLKLVVVNRYSPSPPAIAFIKNFGLKHGAIASSVAHDSHNIIAVGIDDHSIVEAINAIIKVKGGISAACQGKVSILPLPVAGIMSDGDGYEVAKHYKEMDQLAKHMGSTLAAPYMSLSFMALLVIPSLKLSDKGLFDGNSFSFTSLFV